MRRTRLLATRIAVTAVSLVVGSAVSLVPFAFATVPPDGATLAIALACVDIALAAGVFGAQIGEGDTGALGIAIVVFGACFVGSALSLLAYDTTVPRIIHAIGMAGPVALVVVAAGLVRISWLNRRDHLPLRSLALKTRLALGVAPWLVVAQIGGLAAAAWSDDPRRGIPVVVLGTLGDGVLIGTGSTAMLDPQLENPVDGVILRVETGDEILLDLRAPERRDRLVQFERFGDAAWIAITSRNHDADHRCVAYRHDGVGTCVAGRALRRGSVLANGTIRALPRRRPIGHRRRSGRHRARARVVVFVGRTAIASGPGRAAREASDAVHGTVDKREISPLAILGALHRLETTESRGGENFEYVLPLPQGAIMDVAALALAVVPLWLAIGPFPHHWIVGPPFDDRLRCLVYATLCSLIYAVAAYAGACGSNALGAATHVLGAGLLAWPVVWICQRLLVAICGWTLRPDVGSRLGFEGHCLNVVDGPGWQLAARVVTFAVVVWRTVAATAARRPARPELRELRRPLLLAVVAQLATSAPVALCIVAMASPIQRRGQVVVEFDRPASYSTEEQPAHGGSSCDDLIVSDASGVSALSLHSHRFQRLELAPGAYFACPVEPGHRVGSVDEAWCQPFVVAATDTELRVSIERLPVTWVGGNPTLVLPAPLQVWAPAGRCVAGERGYSARDGAS